MDELGCEFTIATPAFPDNARTVFKGHLFVGDVLLSESGMRDHPLTPMTDANLVRVLQAQLAPARRDGRAPRRVGLVDHRATGASAAAIRARFDALRSEGVAIAIADAIDNDDLHRLGEAVRDLPLVCAGSGLAIGLPRNFAHRRLGRGGVAAGGEGIRRDRLGQLLAGDQRAGRRVLARRRRGAPGRSARARRRRRRDGLAADIAAWAEREWSAAPRATGARLQHRAAASGRGGAGALRARTTSARASSGCSPPSPRRSSSAARAASSSPAARPRARACRRSASSDCASARQIDPGVPWCHAAPAAAPDGLQLALKSGNFGGVDFFTRAFAVAT